MKLKHVSLFGFLLVLSSMSFSQDMEQIRLESNIRLQVSAEIYSDVWMPWENYLSGGKQAYPQGNDIIPGFTIELYKPSIFKNLNYVLGTTFIRYNNNFGGWTPYNDIHENQLNGGGIFVGAEFSPRYRFIGLSVKMAMGYFNFDRTVIQNSDHPMNTYTEENHTSSGSLGSILQVSLNAKIRRFYLTPSAKLMMAGGDKMSVIAPGMSLGMGYRFK